MGVGNFPAVDACVQMRETISRCLGKKVDWNAARQGAERTLGKTGAKQSRNLLDEGIGSEEGVVLLGQLLDKFLVLVQFLEIIDRHVL